MRFERLDLRNFKCYEDAAVELDRGVTVIHGINGSGKSTLLEACFFALYGTTALETTLEDVVTIGEEEAEIDLHFAHGGTDYRLRRRIRATGERATTAECVLSSPTETIEGVGDVEDRIVSMLRMDADAFVNSAFVRQGEINKLINATPSERQRMIDRLLQLGKLEDYRERAGEARLGVENLLERWDGRLDTIEAQIEAKTEQDLFERRSALVTELDRLGEEIERYEKNREEAQETLAEANSTLETFEERRDELSKVEGRVEDLRETIAETEQEREELAAGITEHREAITECEERIAERSDAADLDDPTTETVQTALDDLDERRESLREAVIDRQQTVSDLETTADHLEEQATDLDERASALEDEAAELAAEADEIESAVESGEEQLDALEAQIEELESRFEEAPVERGSTDDHLETLRDELDARREDAAEAREELATARSKVEEAEELLAAGKCPECGQPVDGSPHVESLEEYREAVDSRAEALESVREAIEALENRVEDAESLREADRRLESLETERKRLTSVIEERRESVEETRERAAGKREEADALERTAAEKREAAAEKRTEAADVRKEIGSLNGDLGEVKRRRGVLEDLATAIEDRNDRVSDIEDLQERREQLAAQNEERRDHLQDAVERKRSLAEAVGEDQIEAARREQQRAEAYLERVEAALDDLREDRDEQQSALGAVNREIQELEELRENRESVAATVEHLRSLFEETRELETTYGELRSELRQRNVARLERLLNETFDLIYQNDAYARIELNGQYELTVYQKDGNPLEPEQLSGGERALFNLSLRTAIYRLLAEGIEGAAPMPPLILDEPTVFLDAGHVSQLVTLVESMRELGVEQIVVVSHDEELIGAADDVIRVTKDATTNRSRLVESATPLDAD